MVDGRQESPFSQDRVDVYGLPQIQCRRRLCQAGAAFFCPPCKLVKAAELSHSPGGLIVNHSSQRYATRNEAILDK